MKAFIITYIILVIISTGIKVFTNFAEIKLNRDAVIVVFIIEIAFLIWATYTFTSTLSH